jgi:hypothetical protein
MKRILAVISVMALAFISYVGIAQAQDTGPETEACRVATEDFVTNARRVLEFSPNVYPNDTVPVNVNVVNLELLNAILGDTDLGGGARAEVEAAKASLLARDTACAVPATTTPPPTTTVPPVTTEPPATTTAPPVADDKDCKDYATQGDAQVALDSNKDDPYNLDSDNDGKACELYFGAPQVKAPSGGVETGDGSTA